MKVSDFIIHIIKMMCRDLKKFVRVVSEIYKNARKVQFLNEVALIQVVPENGLACKIPRTKIHQNSLASRYDINRHSDAT